MTKPITLEMLAEQIQYGFSAVAGDISDMRGDIANLTTDVAGIKVDISDIRQETRSIRKDLEHLTDKVDNIVGLPKEIDHALERISAVERHLGLNKKIAA